MSQSASNPAGRGSRSDFTDRETFRPRTGQINDVQRLVDEGEYPNKSEFYRKAIDMLLAVEQRRERGQ